MDRQVMGEEFVQKSILDQLSKEGWGKNAQAPELRESGVDIKVRNDKYGRYFLVECKGDPSLKVKSPSGSTYSCMNSATGQIISRMHNNRKRNDKYGYKYGLGFPISFRRRMIQRLPFYVADRLNMYLFFVDYDGSVEMLDWKKLKEVQTEKSGI